MSDVGLSDLPISFGSSMPDEPRRNAETAIEVRDMRPPCVPDDMPGRTWHDGLFDAVACAKLAVFLGVCFP